MRQKLLTHASVKNLRPDPKRREISDRGAPGLRLLIGKSGRKTWIIRCRRPDGRQCKVTLGQLNLSGIDLGEPVLGAPLTVRDARRLAIKLQDMRASGVDIAAFKVAPHKEQVATKNAVASVKKFLRGRLSSSSLQQSTVSMARCTSPRSAMLSRSASNQSQGRLKTLQSASGDEIRLIALLPGDRKLEQELHKKFHRDRLSGEFFKPENVIAFLDQITASIINNEKDQEPTRE